MRSYKSPFILIVFTFTFFACSGGGGSSGGSSVAPSTCTVPTNTIAITVANAETVASEVVGAVQAILAFANLNGAFIDFLNLPISNPTTVVCGSGGNLSLTVTDFDASATITLGDLLSTNFSNCVLMSGSINGIFEALINSASGVGVGSIVATNDWAFNIDGNLVNLSSIDNNINVTADGDVTSNVNFIFAALQLVATATNSAFTFSFAGGQCGSIQNASITSTATNVTTNPSAYFVNVNPSGQVLTVASTRFAGVVTARTVTAFGGMENLDDDMDGEIDEYFSEIDLPDSGVLRIDGLTSSAIVNVMAGGLVRIDVDENGDGVVDQMINTTWTAL